MAGTVFGVATTAFARVGWFSPAPLAICVLAGTQTGTSAMRLRASRMTGRSIKISMSLLIAFTVVAIAVAVSGHLVHSVDGEDAAGGTVVDVALTTTWVAGLKWAQRHPSALPTASPA